MRAIEPAVELIPGFEPENDIERLVAEDPVVRAGLAWGEPRTGHPEGRVGVHVADLLTLIDEWGEEGARRRELRFVALVHDALKYRVREWLPHHGPNHHASRARRLAERYVADERVLATVELHDRPYGIWRKLRRTGRLDERALARMLARVPDPALFLRFVELDGATEGKNPEPIGWFRAELQRRHLAP